MRDQLGDGRVVADHHPGPAELVAQNGPERERVGTGWHTADLVERAHDAFGASLERGLEGRQVHLAQGALGDIYGVVVAPCLGGAVGDVVFWAGRDVAGRLKTAYPGGGHDAAQIRILACALGDAAPARVAAHVHHRSEDPVGADGVCLFGRDARRLLEQRRIPGARFGERDGEDGPIPVDHVEAKEQRDFEA